MTAETALRVANKGLDLEAEMAALGRAAKQAAHGLGLASTETKAKALRAAADSIRALEYRYLVSG